MLGSLAGLSANRYRVEKAGIDVVRQRYAQAFSAGKASSVALRNHRDPLMSTFLSNELEADIGQTVQLTYLVPIVTKCTIKNVTNTSRLDFVFGGKNFEAVIGRTEGGVHVPGSKGSFPLSLPGSSDGKDDIEGMFVNKATLNEARVVTVGCSFTVPSTVVVCTDFGDSTPYNVLSINRTPGLPPSALLYAAVNRELIEGAFLRGMLAQTNKHYGAPKTEQRGERSDSASSNDDWVTIRI